MKTDTLSKQTSSRNTQQDNVQSIQEFYDLATEDYKFWSANYNMHFGFFNRHTSNIFRRDSMLTEMNAQVLNRLGIRKQKFNVVDLGCGMGGTMRYALKKYKQLSAIGVTLSKFQVREGNKFLDKLPGIIVQENFNSTSMLSNSFNGAIAIESFCHAGHNMASFKEAYRLLKPGGKFVIADAFLRKNSDTLTFSSKYCYKKLCGHWHLDQLGDIKTVTKQLEQLGFSHITIENISLKVAPSVLHVPFAIIGFMFKKLWGGYTLKNQSTHNLKGSFYAMLAGLHLKSFGYYIITCKK